jgi:hypothetical protein
MELKKIKKKVLLILSQVSKLDDAYYVKGN